MFLKTQTLTETGSLSLILHVLNKVRQITVLHIRQRKMFLWNQPGMLASVLRRMINWTSTAWRTLYLQAPKWRNYSQHFPDTSCRAATVHTRALLVILPGRTGVINTVIHLKISKTRPSFLDVQILILWETVKNPMILFTPEQHEININIKISV